MRRTPRGVPKSEFARQNWYDVWYPNLAPTVDTMNLGQQTTTEKRWNEFARKYRVEMASPDASRTVDLLAVLSHHANFSVGSYCEDESNCDYSNMRAILAEKGAKLSESRD